MTASYSLSGPLGDAVTTRHSYRHQMGLSPLNVVLIFCHLSNNSHSKEKLTGRRVQRTDMGRGGSYVLPINCLSVNLGTEVWANLILETKVRF